MTKRDNESQGTGGGAHASVVRVPFTYEGSVLVRPIGRGIVLLDAEGEPYLEDLPYGSYQAWITFEPLDEPA